MMESINSAATTSGKLDLTDFKSVRNFRQENFGDDLPVGEVEYDIKSPAEIVQLTALALDAAFLHFGGGLSRPSTDGLVNVFHHALLDIEADITNGVDYGADTKIGRGDFGTMNILDVFEEVLVFLDDCTGIVNDIDMVLNQIADLDAEETEDDLVGDELIFTRLREAHQVNHGDEGEVEGEVE